MRHTKQAGPRRRAPRTTAQRPRLPRCPARPTPRGRTPSGPRPRLQISSCTRLWPRRCASGSFLVPSRRMFSSCIEHQVIHRDALRETPGLPNGKRSRAPLWKTCAAPGGREPARQRKPLLATTSTSPRRSCRLRSPRAPSGPSGTGRRTRTPCRRRTSAWPCRGTAGRCPRPRRCAPSRTRR